ncbi:MAG: hypothetical protein ABR569_05910 [Gaiellaceae bacterium]
MSGHSAEDTADGGTIVVFMGLQTLESVCGGSWRKDSSRPHPPRWSRAARSPGKRSSSRARPACRRRGSPAGPALVVVGEVVALRARLLGEVLQHYVS